MLKYIVHIGPAWSCAMPFGPRATDCFEQGDVVQAVSVESLPGPASRINTVWAKLANGTFVCVEYGRTQYLIPLMGCVPSSDPAHTRPLPGMYRRKI
jgi:hypothetical protein